MKTLMNWDPHPSLPDLGVVPSPKKLSGPKPKVYSPKAPSKVPTTEIPGVTPGHSSGVTAQTYKIASEDNKDVAIATGGMIGGIALNKASTGIADNTIRKARNLTRKEIDQILRRFFYGHPASEKYSGNVTVHISDGSNPLGGFVADDVPLANLKDLKDIDKLYEKWRNSNIHLSSGPHSPELYHEMGHVDRILKEKAGGKFGMGKRFMYQLSRMSTSGGNAPLAAAAVGAGAGLLVDEEDSPMVGATAVGATALPTVYDEAATSYNALRREGREKGLKYAVKNGVPFYTAALGTYVAGGVTLAAIGYGAGAVVKYMKQQMKEKKKIEAHFKEALECFEGFSKEASSIEVEALSNLILREMFRDG